MGDVLNILVFILSWVAIWQFMLFPDQLMYIREYRINRLKVKLAGARAELVARRGCSHQLIPCGTVFPAGITGELFYRTDQNVVYVFTDTGWDPVPGTIDLADLNIDLSLLAREIAELETRLQQLSDL